MKREIKFRAFIEIGNDSQIKAMIPDVVIYNTSDHFGCAIDAFEEAIEPTGYSFNGDDFECKGKESIDAGEFNVYNGDDWVFFDGTPMQFIGLKDKAGNAIYEGDNLLNENNGFVGTVEYQPQGAQFIFRNKETDRYSDFTSCAQYGDENGIVLAGILIIGNIHEGNF